MQFGKLNKTNPINISKKKTEVNSFAPAEQAVNTFTQ